MKTILLRTKRSRELLDITQQIEKAIRELALSAGQTACLLYAPHTTAAITIQETADSAVKEDLLDKLAHLVPHSLEYKHVEGNAHAHIQSSLIGCSVIVPVKDGKLKLGTWQGILFCEFDGPRERNIWVIPLGQAPVASV
ncbi:YjbQ family protein [Candidatus Acetothermia bacterium]|nr:YjbQ family protein [Candidatus Acetothermia bacterium]MBI3643429.1 YjbQ family protein [Candidatus Acetothermia bacterium]